MRPLSSSEILSAFDPIDRNDVVLPNIDLVDWEARDYFAWPHPSGHRTFMVVSLPERTYGLVFRADTPAHPGMCDICLSVNHRSGATLATVDSWSNPRKSIGIHICRDFDCGESARGLRSMDNMLETISTGRRIERLQSNLEKFVRRVVAKE